MNLQQQFTGFLNTPLLWEDSLHGLKQLKTIECNSVSIEKHKQQNIRLGKLVERFVSFELQQDDTINILAENIQIQDDKLTLGELDAIILQNGKPVHVEIIYKFYLYDKNVGTTEIEHWIGPNRKDACIQKLNKLTEKQLPLLYHPKTKPYLEELNLSLIDIEQRVYFKAQLFVPLDEFGTSFPLINNECIYGFYINEKQLQEFSLCKFYIATKHNWLVDVHTHIDWLTFEMFTTALKSYMDDKNSPMCWLKKPNGELYKFFIVWW